MSFSDNVRNARKNKGLSQSNAAERCGIPKSTWVKYENGQIEPTVEPIKAIAKGLGVSTDEILLEEKERSIKQEIRTLFDEIEKMATDEQIIIKKVIKGILMIMHQEKLNS